MKLLNLLVVGFLFLPSSGAFAGDELLNGGDVLECRGNGFPRFQVLDVYEGQTLYGFTFVETPEKSAREIVEAKLKSLKRVDPARSARLEQFWQEFYSEVRFVMGAKFRNIADEGWISVPFGCELQQAVVQLEKPTPDMTRYLVNLTLWSALSENGKAAMILHELIYREGLLPQNDFKNSHSVRYFNAFLNSTSLEKVTIQEYREIVEFVGFKD